MIATTIMRRHRRVTVSAAAVLLATTAYAVQQRRGASREASDPWAPINFLVGSWEGTGSGQPGESRIERHYERVLQDQFIHGTNRSVFDPQKANPSGEVHEDWSMFSFDRSRKRIVLRQFHTEGYITQYVLSEVRDGGKTLVFETEAIENGMPRMKARYIYNLLSNDEFTESFELAMSGGALKPCVTTHMMRKK